MAAPDGGLDKLFFVLRCTLNPWILSAYAAALCASLSWLAAMTRLELSHAYPFMSLNFVLVMVLSTMLFHEAVTPPKLGGYIQVRETATEIRIIRTGSP